MRTILCAKCLACKRSKNAFGGANALEQINLKVLNGSFQDMVKKKMQVQG